MTNFLDIIFNPWLGPVINLPAFWAILIISVGITFLITIVYKYTTNQAEMKRIKTDLKKYQKEMRETKDLKKLKSIQGKALELNMKYMMASFKSTLYTFIPIIIIFAWLSMHIAYHPILPQEEFSVTAKFGEGARGNVSIESMPELTIIGSNSQEIIDGKAVWRMKGDAGEYKLTVTYNSEVYDTVALITTEKAYATPEKVIRDSKLKMIVVGNKPVHPFGETFNIFGWYPGWLATYIVLSLLLSFGFRKLLDVY